MSELARRADTPRETIHHYMRLGLLSKPQKTSKNMAYYDDRHVDELKIIQKLRAESYLPLDKIKLILDEGRLAASAREVDLAGELFGQGARVEPMTRDALTSRTGLDAAVIEGLIEVRVLRPVDGLFGYEDLRVAELVAEARKTPAIDEALIERFAILEEHVARMVDDELRHFFAMVAAGIDAESGLDLLRTGRETIGRFLAVARGRRMREGIEGVFSDVAKLARTPFVPAPPVPLEKRAKDVVVTLDYLLLMGDYAEVMARANNPQDAAYYGEAAVELAYYPEALARLAPYRASVTDRPPRIDVAWAAAVLARARDQMGAETSLAAFRGDVMRDMMSGLTVLARAAGRAEMLTDPLEKARTDLLIGRVYGMTPSFLGLREASKEALIRARDGALRLVGGVHDPGSGALERIATVASDALV